MESLVRNPYCFHSSELVSGLRPTEINATNVTMSLHLQFEETFEEKNSGEKSNRCNQCDYASSQADNLRSLLKTCIEEKSNKWNKCEFGCSDPSSLRSHMK